eukprot:gene8106-1352_t
MSQAAELAHLQIDGNGMQHEKHIEAQSDESENHVKLKMDGGLRIVFKELNYSVTDDATGGMFKKGEQLYLLKDVNGWLEPCQMTALMGPSGSGKTTMLDVMAGRKTEGVMMGTLLFGGEVASQSFLRKYTGYVEQFDTLLGMLTVEEMLMYTAEMKRPASESVQSKKAAVALVLKKLVLEGCKDVKIGTDMEKGISGGQAKRTNIGLSLITNPRVLFLDEPTTGLDSYTANQVMRVVRTLLDDGTTICATIHSPSQFTFSLFDDLLMLVKGRVVYFGPASEGPTFAISICPDVKERSDGYNDAEFLVDLITEADRKGRGNEIAVGYAESSLFKANAGRLERFVIEQGPLHEDVQRELKTKTATVTPWYHGWWVLFKYRTTRNYRDPEWLGPRLGDKFFVSLLMMTLYLGKGDDFSNSNLGNLSALLFAWVLLPSYGAAAYVPSLVMERGLFSRERNDGLYITITYLLHKMFEEFLMNLVFSVGIAAYTFYGIDFYGEFVLFWLVYFVMLCVGVQVAYLVAAVSPSLDAANALLPAYVTTWLFFGGFLLTFDKMPWYWKWYSYIVPLKYCWGSLMVNMFSGDGGDPIWDEGTNKTVLETYSLENVDKWAYLGYTSLFWFVYFIGTVLAMSFKKYQSR